MACNTPLKVDYMFDPMSLLQTPLVQNLVDGWFEGLLLSQEISPPVPVYDLQSACTIDPAGWVGPTDLFLVQDYSYATTPQSMPSETLCISPALLINPHSHVLPVNEEVTSDDNWVLESFGPSASSPGVPPLTDYASRTSPQVSRDLILSAWSVSESTRYNKPNGCLSDDSSLSSSSGHLSRPSASHTDSNKKTVPTPRCSLPQTLQPIKVAPSTLPRCPMPGCGILLEDRDSAWRGHFKRCHHAELCRTPGCHGAASGTCKARCPCPLPGPEGRSCQRGGEMSIESVGRHLLNVHIKVLYRCPVCGFENAWRESACARHIRRCVEKWEEEETRKRIEGQQ